MVGNRKASMMTSISKIDFACKYFRTISVGKSIKGYFQSITLDQKLTLMKRNEEERKNR